MLDHAAITSWVDGGWGIGALLGRRDPRHDDLDLTIDHDIARYRG